MYCNCNFAYRACRNWTIRNYICISFRHPLSRVSRATYECTYLVYTYDFFQWHCSNVALVFIRIVFLKYLILVVDDVDRHILRCTPLAREQRSDASAVVRCCIRIQCAPHVVNYCVRPYIVLVYVVYNIDFPPLDFFFVSCLNTRLCRSTNAPDNNTMYNANTIYHYYISRVVGGDFWVWKICAEPL